MALSEAGDKQTVKAPTTLKHSCDCNYCGINDKLTPLAELSAFLNLHLTTNFQGNWCIDGQPIGNDARLTQLREVFELKNKCEEVLASLEAKQEKAALKTVVQAQKAGQPSKGQMATYRRELDEAKEQLRRDFSIELDNKFKGVDKAEEFAKKNAKDYTSLLKKFATLEDTYNVMKKENVALKKEYSALEASIRVSAASHREEVRLDIKDVTAQEVQKMKAEVKAEATGTDDLDLYASTLTLNNTNRRHARMLQDHAQTLEQHTETLDWQARRDEKNIKTLFGERDKHFERLESHDADLAKLTSWHETYVSWRRDVLLPGLEYLAEISRFRWFWG